MAGLVWTRRYVELCDPDLKRSTAGVHSHFCAVCPRRQRPEERGPRERAESAKQFSLFCFALVKQVSTGERGA
jgi:hypothetical protein